MQSDIYFDLSCCTGASPEPVPKRLPRKGNLNCLEGKGCQKAAKEHTCVKTCGELLPTLPQDPAVYACLLYLILCTFEITHKTSAECLGATVAEWYHSPPTSEAGVRFRARPQVGNIAATRTPAATIKMPQGVVVQWPVLLSVYLNCRV